MSNSMSLKTVAVVVMLCGMSRAAAAVPEPNSQPARQRIGIYGK